MADAMHDVSRSKLLFGPYRPPPLKRGDRAFCLLRDRDVVVTSWTDARISWPRCRPLDRPLGGSGILLDEELARAVLQESAAAICYWWGVSEGVVWRWRRVLGVGRTNNEGTRRLVRAAAEAGAAERRGKPLPREEVEQRRRTARELNLGQYLQPGYHGPVWTREQLALLGTLPDEEVARRTSRTPRAVRVMRRRRGVPPPPGAQTRRRWSAREDAVVRQLSPGEAAERTGRTAHAVYHRRRTLGVATGQKKRPE
jgi:hypothetical protein